MPYPSQIDKSTIVEQARLMIEADGVDALSLAKLAGALGVKAPSLYRYVKNKAELLAEVSFLTFGLLIESLDPDGEEEKRGKEKEKVELNAAEKLVMIAKGFRTFARANPRTYVLAFTAQERGDEEQLVQLILPIQRIVAEVVPAGQVRAALRGLMALLHGFVMLEIHAQLRRGGDLGIDFEDAVRSYIAGWGAEQ